MILVVCLEGNSLTTNRATSSLPHGYGAVMSIGNDDGDGLPTDPSYTDSTTKANVPFTEAPLEQSDPALAIVSKYNPRAE